jgi:hypothetical protein
MTQLLRSLQTIITGHTRFAPDQVLTSAQLNGVADYLDDGERLTRVELFGVGIAGGLHVSLAGNQVTLTRGVGVTTDGDLIYVPADAVYTQFKPYGDGAPGYAPFASDGGRIPAWELVRDGVPDARALPLDQFSAHSDRSLNDLVALLLMESWIKDQDVCTGADCDNMGGQCLNDLRLILIDKRTVGPFRETFVTPDSAARQLDAITVDRPSFGGITTVGALGNAYRNTCNTMLARIEGALKKLYPICGVFLSDLFPNDPAGAWIQSLSIINDRSGVGLQYYYDFLKDLAETYSAFREQLFGDTSVACPDLAAFPKHLLLGSLAPTADRNENRTGFYPSPQLVAAGGRLDHARFLATKLSSLILNFSVPSSIELQIRITPSSGEDHSLEERAIPFYYNTRGNVPIHSTWSYALERRGMSAFNYSYNADQYAAQGGAAAPLTSQIGRFTFFRVEGHLGKPVGTVVDFLQGEITNKNLPFAIHAVMLGSDKKRIFPWPPRFYGDFNLLHDLARYGLSDQLDDAADYGAAFSSQLDGAIGKGVVVGDESNNVREIRDNAVTKAGLVRDNAVKASAKLRRGYSEFKTDDSWRSDVTLTLQAAGELKQGVTKVAKTEFATPMDSLIDSTSLQWIDWIDLLIQNKNDKADDHRLFGTYLAKHGGLEHFAGVARGGTFVLVYDETSNVVVADFMLPYLCCVPDAEELPPPPVKPPRIRPGFLFDRGMTLATPVDVRVLDHINQFWVATEPEVKKEIAIQKEYLQLYKDSVQVVGGITTKRTSFDLADPLLSVQLQELDLKSQKRDLLQQMLLNPSVSDADKKLATDQLQQVESEVAKLAADTTQRVVSQNLDVREGGDGFKALAEVSRQVGMLRNPQAVSTFKTGVGALGTLAKSDQMKNVLSTLTRG